jgi:hypothetical protein
MRKNFMKAKSCKQELEWLSHSWLKNRGRSSVKGTWEKFFTVRQNFGRVVIVFFVYLVILFEVFASYRVGFTTLVNIAIYV